MIEISQNGAAAAPAAPVPVIDRAHLSAMTLGDRALEREVLQLFDQQAALLLERLRHGPAAGIAAIAHTLKGSARGLGAWGLAEAAARVERHAAFGGPPLAAAVTELIQAAEDVRGAIRHLVKLN